MQAWAVKFGFRYITHAARELGSRLNFGKALLKEANFYDEAVADEGKEDCDEAAADDGEEDC